MKMPSFQFYPADWRKDPAVQSLDYHDRGVWFEILCLMHESEERGVLLLNGRPMPDEALARLLGLDKQILTTTLTTLLTYGVAKQRQEDGAVYCKRMVADERLTQIRREAGKRGGNPNLLNQNPTTRDNQNPTPSSSSSSSSSDNITPLPPKGGDGRAGKERRKTERRDELTIQQRQFFNLFWAAYPRKTNKGHAEKAWKSLAPDSSLVNDIISAIGRAKKSPQWIKDAGQFIPHPATWLRAKGWEDEFEEQSSGRVIGGYTCD